MPSPPTAHASDSDEAASDRRRLARRPSHPAGAEWLQDSLPIIDSVTFNCPYPAVRVDECRSAGKRHQIRHRGANPSRHIEILREKARETCAPELRTLAKSTEPPRPSRCAEFATLRRRSAPCDSEQQRKPRMSRAFVSTATGIRTPVSAVRGRRPSPLDDGGSDGAVRVAEHCADARCGHAHPRRRFGSACRAHIAVSPRVRTATPAQPALVVTGRCASGQPLRIGIHMDNDTTRQRLEGDLNFLHHAPALSSRLALRMWRNW